MISTLVGVAIAQIGCNLVEEFVQHTLETALRKSSAAPEDDPRVLERLKGLGYIE